MEKSTSNKTGWFQLMRPSRFHLAFREIRFEARAMDGEGVPASGMEIRLGKRVIVCKREGEENEGRFAVPFRTGKGWKAARVWVRWASGRSERVGRFLFYSLMPAKENPMERDYPAWVREHGPDEREWARIGREIKNLPHQPLISILLPVYNTDPRYLREAVDSVIGQIYPNWQLCIADDASTREDTKVLLREYEKKEERITICWREKNGHISEASNSALDLAKGDWVGLLDHDDTLLPHSLARVVLEINQHPDACFFYSDEDKIAEDSSLLSPYFKPGWNPLFLESQNYICHFSVVRQDTMRGVGGFRRGYEGSQDWDLFLRLSRNLPKGAIRHIPEVLYHWREIEGSVAKNIGQKNYTVQAAERALDDHFEGREYEKELVGGMYWVYAPPAQSNHSLILVGPEVNVESAIAKSTAEVVVLFFGGEVPKVDGNLLARLCGWAMRTDIGVVSGSLYQDEDWITEGGWLIDASGHLTPAFRQLKSGFEGMGRREILPQNWSIPGIRLVALRKELWDKAGGWCADYESILYQWIDFCLRVEKLGLRNAFLPFLRFPLSPSEALFHSENNAKDAERLKRNWPQVCERDLAGHPNLTTEPGFFTMKWGNVDGK